MSEKTVEETLHVNMDEKTKESINKLETELHKLVKRADTSLRNGFLAGVGTVVGGIGLGLGASKLLIKVLKR